MNLKNGRIKAHFKSNLSLFCHLSFLFIFVESQEGDHQDLINDHENIQEFIEFSINPSFEQNQNYEIEPQGYLKFCCKLFSLLLHFLSQTQSPISHFSF